LNIDTGYAAYPQEPCLTRTAGEAVRLINRAGALAIVVSNQSGVARGYFGLCDVERFHDALQGRLAAFGARIDAFYFCPYHPEGSVAQFAMDHADRKPSPGMLLRAMADWPIDRATSVLIGDKPTDIDAAKAAGVQGVLVDCNTEALADVVRQFVA
jgi:D-glycero-D-manno-heptose 1,7-bisphosphate phosphatase